jgi:hypothetical protein
MGSHSSALVNTYDVSTSQGGTCSICYDENRLLGYPRCCQLRTKRDGICTTCIIELAESIGLDLQFKCPFCRSTFREKILSATTSYNSNMLICTQKHSRKPRWRISNLWCQTQHPSNRKFIYWPFYYVPHSYKWNCFICNTTIDKNIFNQDSNFVVGNLSSSAIMSVCKDCITVEAALSQGAVAAMAASAALAPFSPRLAQRAASTAAAAVAVFPFHHALRRERI